MRETVVTAGLRWRAAVFTWGAVVVLLGVLPTQGAVHAVAGERESLLTTGGHFLEYVALAFLMAAALSARTPGRATLLRAWGGASALGVGVELVQALLPYRDFQMVDIATNAAGAALGISLLSLLTWAGGRPQRARRG